MESVHAPIFDAEQKIVSFGNWQLVIGNSSVSAFFGHILLIISGGEQPVQFLWVL